MSYDGIVQSSEYLRSFAFTTKWIHLVLIRKITHKTPQKDSVEKVFETFNISDIFHKYPQPLSCCVPAVNIIIIIITLCNAY